MNAWFIFLAIFGGFLLIVVVGYFIYYRTHNRAEESQPKRATDPLDNVEEVNRRETFRERARQFFRVHP